MVHMHHCHSASDSLRPAKTLLAATLRFSGGLVSKGVFIVSAVRTAIGKFGGKLARMTSPDLGVIAATVAAVVVAVSLKYLCRSLRFASERDAAFTI